MHLPRTWARVDLNALARNLRFCRAKLDGRCQVLGVVKADAYGHGAIRVARALEANGITMLGVGDSHEAIQLREAGLRCPILILGAVVESELPQIIAHRITPMVHSPERIQIFDREAKRAGVQLPVHLLLDTGMSRLGVTPQRALEHLDAIDRSPNLVLQGMGTHFASPAEDPDFTREQLGRFERVVKSAQSMRLPIPCLHVASSVAFLNYPEAHYDMVRLGGHLYGIVKGDSLTDIEPILSLHTQVVYLRDLPAGSRVSYHNSYRTQRWTRVATLPVGYHDGYHSRLSPRAHVLVHGQRAPVIGRVTMDYIMVDVTDIPNVSVGDAVTLLGHNGGESVSALDLAEWAGTVAYEIPSQLGSRVRREYVGAGAVPEVSGDLAETPRPDSARSPRSSREAAAAEELSPADRLSPTQNGPAGEEPQYWDLPQKAGPLGAEASERDTGLNDEVAR